MSPSSWIQSGGGGKPGYREHIDCPLDLVREADAFRVELNTVRPHEHLSWNRPANVHTGRADLAIPTFPEPEILPTT